MTLKILLKERKCCLFLQEGAGTFAPTVSNTETSFLGKCEGECGKLTKYLKNKSKLWQYFILKRRRKEIPEKQLGGWAWEGCSPARPWGPLGCCWWPALWWHSPGVPHSLPTKHFFAPLGTVLRRAALPGHSEASARAHAEARPGLGKCLRPSSETAGSKSFLN